MDGIDGIIASNMIIAFLHLTVFNQITNQVTHNSWEFDKIFFILINLLLRFSWEMLGVHF